ncbi:MAG: maleylpyruvate isomerase family mycothiol-dependent enzyme [Actinomycetota bacterium]
MGSAADRHRRACAGFGEVVAAGNGRWDVPTPCTEWDARDLVEHVIGFHEVLLLRPLEIKAHRPHGDVPARWDATASAIDVALEELSDEMRNLLPALTTDVLVHTWDLARAVGADEHLDPELVQRALGSAQPGTLAQSGMFAAPVPVSSDAAPWVMLLGAYGRRV